MAEEKKTRLYTVADVLASMKAQDFELKVFDGVMKFRYHPLTYGNLKLMLRAGKSKDVYERGDVLLMHSIKVYDKDKDGRLIERDFTPEDLEKLPSGLIGDLHGKLGELSGLRVEEKELKKLLESMTA